MRDSSTFPGISRINLYIDELLAIFKNHQHHFWKPLQFGRKLQLMDKEPCPLVPLLLGGWMDSGKRVSFLSIRRRVVSVKRWTKGQVTDNVGHSVYLSFEQGCRQCSTDSVHLPVVFCISALPWRIEDSLDCSAGHAMATCSESSSPNWTEHEQEEKGGKQLWDMNRACL